MQVAGRLYVRTWMDRADNAYRASRDIAATFAYGGAVPMFLLHWAIELYLKGFLMSNNSFRRGHKLNELYKLCKQIDPKIDKIEMTDLRGSGKTSPTFWINFIDVFGAEKGGVRYLNKSKTMFAYPSNIHSNFDQLVEYIKNDINPDTDITEYC